MVFFCRPGYSWVISQLFRLPYNTQLLFLPSLKYLKTCQIFCLQFEKWAKHLEHKNVVLSYLTNVATIRKDLTSWLTSHLSVRAGNFFGSCKNAELRIMSVSTESTIFWIEIKNNLILPILIKSNFTTLRYFVSKSSCYLLNEYIMMSKPDQGVWVSSASRHICSQELTIYFNGVSVWII